MEPLLRSAVKLDPNDLEMSDSGKAVFLSYPREDSAAVHRIAEALRAADVEV
jgi:hypothetical protein